MSTLMAGAKRADRVQVLSGNGLDDLAAGSVTAATPGLYRIDVVAAAWTPPAPSPTIPTVI